MEMAGNGVPRAIGQGCVALLSGLEVPWVNWAREVRQCVCGWAKSKGLSAVCCMDCCFHCSWCANCMNNSTNASVLYRLSSVFCWEPSTALSWRRQFKAVMLRKVLVCFQALPVLCASC